MAINPTILRRISWSFGTLILFVCLFYAAVTLQHHESTLAISPSSEGVSVPDGFSVWHQLDANGIRFKSITPHADTLLIKFDSSDQSAAAKEVLDRSLPHGYIIAQQDEDEQAIMWLTRLRDTSRRLG